MGDRIADERLSKILERKLYFGLDEGQAIAAELRDARADLREAMELLAQVDDGQVPHDTWLDARNALLAKYKETP